MIQVYHNQRCSKSRECVAFLNDTDQKYEIIKYLETPPTRAELEILIEKLGLEPIQLVRRKEKIWIDNYKNQNLSSADVIQILIENPILIERPIIIRGDKAIIGRPKEAIIAFLNLK